MKHRVLLLLWLLTDLLLFVVSGALAYGIRVGWILSTDLPVQKFLIALALSSPVWLLSLVTTRTFSLTRSQQTPRNFAYIMYASFVGAAITALAYFFLFGQVFSRLLLVESFLLTTILVFAWHVIFERLMRSMLTGSSPSYPTLILGVTRESRALIQLLKKKKSPLCPVGVIDASGSKEQMIEGVPFLGKLPKIEEAMEKLSVTHVLHASELEQSLNVLGMCRSRGITYLLLPSVLGMVERDERIESLEGVAVISVSSRKGSWRWFFD